MKIFYCLRLISVLIAVDGETTTKRLEVKHSYKVNISCFQNCYPAMPHLEIVFQITCDNRPCPDDVGISYNVRPSHGEFNLLTDATSGPDYLVLKAGVFTPGAKLYVEAKIGESTVSTDLILDNYGRTYEFSCLENCPLPYIEKDTVVGIVCKPDCTTSYFDWVIDPFVEGVEFLDDDARVMFKANTFKEDTIVDIQVYVDGVDFNNSLHFIPPPIIEILCKFNCWQTLLSINITLEAKCLQHCYGGEYEWLFQPSLSNFTVTGLQRELLIVPPYVLDVNESYKVLLSLNQRTEVSAVLKPRNCVVIPSTGISAQTLFKITCLFKIVNNTLIFQQTDPFDDDHGLLVYEGKGIQKAIFYLTAGKDTKISVLVPAMRYNQHIFVTVSPMLDENQKKYLRYFSAVRFNYISSLLKNGSWSAAIQQSSAFVTSLKDTKSNQMRYYIKKVLKEMSKDFESMAPLQLVTLLSEFGKLSESNDTFTKKLMGDALFAAVSKAAIIDSYSPTKLDIFANRVHEVASSIASKSKEMEEDVVVPHTTTDSDYKIYDEVYYKRVSAFYHLRQSTLSAINALEKLSSIRDSENNPFSYVSVDKGITSTTERIDHFDEIIQAKNIGSQVQISKELKDELNSFGNAYVLLTSLKPNPLWWHPASKSMTSEFLMVNIYSNGQKITDLKTGQVNVLVESQSDPANLISIKGELIKDVLIVYKINIQPLTTLDLTFIHFGNDYTAYLSYTYPTTKIIKRMGFVIKNATMITRRVTNLDKNVYLGIARWLGDKPIYGVIVKARTCLSFKSADNLVSWSPEFCSVGDQSNASYIHCECNHFSFFSASFFVPPTKIELLQSFTINESVTRSSIMTIVIAVVTLTYLCLMIIAFYIDQKSAKVTTIDVLPDNYPGYRNMYIVCVETRLYLGPPTARIILEIHGEKGNSDRHFVNGRMHVPSEREDWFAIFTMNELGHLVSIRLFHDSSGVNPNWFCDRITIQHPRTEGIYVFLVQQWLSPIYGSGLTDRTIPLANKGRLKKGVLRLPSSLNPKKKENILLTAIFFRFNEKNYTLKQRFTVYYVTALLSMVTNAMFYVYELDGWDEGFNIITDVSTRDIVIYFESLAITFPIGICLALLFKYSMPSTARTMTMRLL